VAAQPLPVLDFLIEAPERGAIVDGTPVLVNVPAPARFALHKLAVARSRPLAGQTKADKDLLQAGALLEVLFDDRPGDVDLAWQALGARGNALVTKVKAGMSALRVRRPELAGRLARLR
jgi:hypothetical protein